jgi:hypothetical protein
MKNKVQSVDWREKEIANGTCRWPRRFNPDSGPASQSDRLMTNQKVDRWKWRRRYSKGYAKRKARWRWVDPRLTMGQRVSFRKFLTPVRVLFYF